MLQTYIDAKIHPEDPKSAKAGTFTRAAHVFISLIGA